MYIIKDWSGNVLDFKGRFKGPQLAVPMTFDSFEDGWEWVYLNVPDNDSAYDDVFVEELLK